MRNVILCLFCNVSSSLRFIVCTIIFFSYMRIIYLLALSDLIFLSIEANQEMGN